MSLSRLDLLVDMASKCHVTLDRAKLDKTCRQIEGEKGPEWPFSDEVYPVIKAPGGKSFISIQEIGRGVFKHVHLAVDYRDNRLVAISRIHSQPIGYGTFEREVVAIKRLHGKRLPGVAEIYHAYLSRMVVGRYYCGRDLSHHRFLSTEAKDKIAKQVLKGIYCLHRVGILHRDIKPENILLSLTEEGALGSAVLSDFGSSTLMEENTCVKKFVSDQRHRPPEVDRVARGSKEEASLFRPSYDIWSFGLTLIRIYRNIGFTELPWEAHLESNLEAVERLKNRVIYLIPPPDRVAAAIEEMVHPDPFKRPSAHILLRRLYLRP